MSSLKSPLPVHSPTITHLLSIHRETLLSLSEKWSHPFFFYDVDLFRQRLQEIISTFSPHVMCWYATKANPLSEVIKVVRDLGMGVDVASSGELDQAIRCGMRAEKILTTCPCRNRDDFRLFLHQGVRTFVIESYQQLRWLGEVVRELKDELSLIDEDRPRVLLRVQLAWDKGEDEQELPEHLKVLGAEKITPFGLDLDEWRSLKSNQQFLDLKKQVNICGLHVFQWGNQLEVDSLGRVWKECARQLKSLAKDLGIHFEILDVGGGLGIPYADSDQDLNLLAMSEALKVLKEESQVDQVWMELGRFAIGPCGIYLTPIVDRKKVRGVDQLILRGGIHHLARPALTKQAFPCFPLKEKNKNMTNQQFSLHGPLCTALDHLGDHQLPKDIEIEDWLCFTQCGAYGFTESMPFFLCHDLCSEVVWKEKRILVPRPPRSASWWMA